MEVVPPQDSGGDDGFDGLIATSENWAGHYKVPHGDEQRRQESVWEIGGLDPGVVFGCFEGWGSEPGRRRLTRPRRECVGGKETITYPRALRSIHACFLFEMIFR